jgi:hypothetical protein
MMKPKIVLDLKIVQTADQLIIRTSRKIIVVWMVVACVFAALSLFTSYRRLMGNADASASWNRAGHDGFEVALAFFPALPFLIVPLGCVVYYARKRRRGWVFDRRRGQLTRLDQSWPLAGFTAVAIDARVARKAFSVDSAGVILHFGDADMLELARFPAGKHRSLERRIQEATDLANVIGEFLHLPVHQPPPANQGFDVVQPAGRTG